MLVRNPNFEARTECEVTRINLDNTGKRATGVTYVDSSGDECEQPADLVLLCAFQLFNVQLLLLSGIGTPYDPQTGKGQIGRNFAYQTISTAIGFFDKDKYNFNPFIASGAIGMCIDEFNGDNFDHSQLGFVGGGYIGQVQTNGRPIETRRCRPARRPGARSGSRRCATIISAPSICGAACHGSFYSYRDVYLDLDPTYKDRFGRPLLRMTIDFHDNELKMSAFLTDKYAEILQQMGAKQVVKQPRKGPYDVTDYQTSHLCGGAIMGDDPGQQRAEPLSAELGRAESVRAGRHGLSAKRRLQPDRHGRCAGLLVGGGDPLPIPQKPGAAGPCVTRAQCASRFAVGAGVVVRQRRRGRHRQAGLQANRARPIPGNRRRLRRLPHLPESGKRVRRRAPIETPFGNIVAPNITPDPADRHRRVDGR